MALEAFQEAKQRSGREAFSLIRAGTDLNVLFAGQQQSTPRQRSGGIRTNYSLHAVSSGSGTLKVGGKTFRLSTGMAFAFFPGIQVAYSADALEPWAYSWIGFVGRRAEELLKNAGMTRELPVTRVKDMASIKKHHREMLKRLQNPRPGNGTVADGILYQILGEMVGGTAAGSEESFDFDWRRSYVDRATQFMRANYQRRINAGSVCSYVGLTRSYFTSLFRKRTGTTIIGFLQRLRMDRAQELLHDASLSITQVAHSCGYRDYRVFERWFRDRLGKSPSAFRRKVLRSSVKPG